MRNAKQQLHKLLALPLMAAVLFCQSSCGRLGYDEHTRAPLGPDAGGQPEPDEDAGDP